MNVDIVHEGCLGRSYIVVDFVLYSTDSLSN